MSWYRIYRPQTVEGLHLAQARTALTAMLKSGNIPHALLFAGPKGTGKTSSARIVAKVINCEKNQKRKPKEPFHEPCLKCSQCTSITNGSALNVIEIDGASNRRIDDIRSLKESIYITPAQGSKSVYIIDEVHMLTKEAFNALLKILEEPPAHAMFIFATTETHKVPETIRSRTTEVLFSKATKEELRSALKDIVTKEKLKIDEDVLDVIIAQSDGSFRDAVKLLEQTARTKGQDGKIRIQDLRNSVAYLSADNSKEFVSYILAKDEHSIVEFFQRARSQALDPVLLHKSLVTFLHAELMKCLKVDAGEPVANTQIVMFLLKKFGEIPLMTQSPFPYLPLEICTLEMVLKSKEKGGGQKTEGKGQVVQKDTKAQESKMSSLDRQEVVMQALKVENQEDEQDQDLTSQLAGRNSSLRNEDTRGGVDKVIEGMSSISNLQPPSTIDGSLLQNRWSEFLSILSKKNMTVEALLRSAKFVGGQPGAVEIEVYYKFHKEQLELDRYKIIVEEAVRSLLGGTVLCRYVLAEPQTQSAKSNISGSVEPVTELVSMVDEVLL